MTRSSAGEAGRPRGPVWMLQLIDPSRSAKSKTAFGIVARVAERTIDRGLVPDLAGQAAFGRWIVGQAVHLDGFVAVAAAIAVGLAELVVVEVGDRHRRGVS